MYARTVSCNHCYITYIGTFSIEICIISIPASMSCVRHIEFTRVYIKTNVSIYICRLYSFRFEKFFFMSYSLHQRRGFMTMICATVSPKYFIRIHILIYMICNLFCGGFIVFEYVTHCNITYTYMDI